jgi:hypothetical protein
MIAPRAVSGIVIIEWAPAACAAIMRLKPVPESISLICCGVMAPNAGV